MTNLIELKTDETAVDELPDATRSSVLFDLDRSAKIGKHIQARRILRGLSAQQLAARLAIRTADVNAYEQGTKRMSCKLLLETAKQLNATPRYFFQ